MDGQVRAEIVGTVISVDARVGQRVGPGDVVAVLESMKMEIPVVAEDAGRVRQVVVGRGDIVRAGEAVALLDPV